MNTIQSHDKKESQQTLLSLAYHSAKAKALAHLLQEQGLQEIRLEGLVASATPMLFASLATNCPTSIQHPLLFVMNDEEQAGYFYHDLTQILGNAEVSFLPSSYRRAVKYGQRDSGNEILRTDALSALRKRGMHLVVTYPEALSEKVVSREKMQLNTIDLQVGMTMDLRNLQKALIDLGMRRSDYVYEPGQFAVRGSLVDVYSYSCEYPFRIDFFGDEIDSLRTFDVQTQLSVEKLREVSIVPETSDSVQEGICILDYLDPQTVLVTQDMDFIRDEVERVWNEGFSLSARIAEQEEYSTEGNSLVKELLLVEPGEFYHGLPKFRRVLLQTSASGGSNIAFDISPQPIFHKNFNLLIQVLQRFQKDGYGIFILADSAKQTDRLKSILTDMGSGVTFTPINQTLHEGFVDKERKMVLFTDHQIFDRFHKYSLRSEHAHRGKIALTLKEIQQFQLGDYVVHIDHGVGRFGGLVTLPEGENMVEKIRINYDGGGVIYVSIHALHKVAKYKGQDGVPPKVNKLGGRNWENLKERTKKKIKDIARDLILLYSKRRQEKGFRFSPDTYLQTELEASFLYEDTPDQMKASMEVKNDMERQRPMDRLVCGDVGFGKTEVAIRAAFKATADGKQVAVLVPTTPLAYQHYSTFSSRLKEMPVRVDYLSRARSAKETREILEDLKEGKIDIIIGTHKLIGKTVKFHDLGLLVIDEEQKFGVSTKETLRKMKSNVDTLTLTATPIPRTLQFSLMGARDMSVIQTPPPNRYPIQTQVCCFSSEVIAEAVEFEMSRNGQVYIVSNRISSLPELESIVKKYVPDARVVTGHGQMSPERLEEIILGFVDHDYDVLISTTIIESGMDIPNANTIIICNAQNFGLSDLHQMRGRVGRSNKKAFCYLLSPPLSALNPEARRRLQAIETFSDLGSGLHIAMQDLDIRGAGNLLGAEQSGFIADLGYETYQKILSEAVKELRNEEFANLYNDDHSTTESDMAEQSQPARSRQQPSQGEITSRNLDDQGSLSHEGRDTFNGGDFVDECQLETDLPARLPDSYVPTSSERMLLYRELDQMEQDSQIDAFCSRLKDRFGPLPHEAEDLCNMIRLRRMGKSLGAERLILKNGEMRLYFVSAPRSPYYQSVAFGQIVTYYSMNAANCKLFERNGHRFLSISGVKTVQCAMDILSNISNIVI